MSLTYDPSTDPTLFHWTAGVKHTDQDDYYLDPQTGSYKRKPYPAAEPANAHQALKDILAVASAGQVINFNAQGVQITPGSNPYAMPNDPVLRLHNVTYHNTACQADPDACARRHLGSEDYGQKPVKAEDIPALIDASENYLRDHPPKYCIPGTPICFPNQDDLDKWLEFLKQAGIIAAVVVGGLLVLQVRR